MKRARIDDDFNPVYPYNPIDKPPVTFITPPFTSSDGLQEKPPGVLSLNYKNPVVVQNGALTLKLGSGLSVNDSGELTSDVGEVAPPLFKQNKILGLAYGEPLTLQDSKLIIALTDPLSLQSGRLGLQYSSPLTLQNSKLTLPLGAPLVNDNETLTLRLQRPLLTDINNALTLSTEAPLSTTTGSLRLNSVAPLGIAKNALRVLFSSPLYLQNDFLTLAVEQPLATTSGGKLALQVTQPFKIEKNALSLDTASPLSVQNNSLTVSVTPPLKIFDTSLGVVCKPPLTTNESALSLNTGNGLTVNDSTLQVNIGSGLQFSNGAITAIGTAITAQPPLVYSNNELSINIGGGLRYSSVYKSIAIKNDPFKGLDIDYYGFLVPKLGNGLRFNTSNGNIDVVFPSPPEPQPDTLWTSPDPSANCTLFEELDAKVWLSLVKTGSMVHGLISVKILKGLSQGPPTNYNFLSIILQFNENGIRIAASPSSAGDEFQGTIVSSATWGYKTSNSTDTNITNAKRFMPNSTRYPRGGTTVQNELFGNSYIQGRYDMPVPYTLKFNTVDVGYSIIFKWGIVRLQKPDLPDCPFSYISEE